MSRRPLRRLAPPLVTLALVALLGRGAGDAPGAPPARPRGVARAEGYGKLPLLFVENGGQAAGDVSHVVPGKATTVLFGSGGLGVRLWRGPRREACPDMRAESVCIAGRDRARPPDALAAMAAGARAGGPDRGTVDALELDFVGARKGLRAEGRRMGPGRVSYFRGPESEWKRSLRTYGELVYRDVWPGIDVVYEAGLNELKHSFVVRPGADPGLIRLAWRGATGLMVDAGGQLVVGTPAGVLLDQAPVAFQEVDGRRIPVAARYAVGEGGPDGARPYGFALGHYDRGATLVIDPAMVVYASIMGTEGDDRGLGIEVDDDRNAYITGEHLDESFVAKIDPTGTQLLYMIIVGGEGIDAAFDIDVDPRGAAYFTGSTQSPQRFPAKGGPDMTYNGGGSDAFVAKVAPDGQDLEYAGFIGGAGVDFAEAIAVDEDGHAYVSGDVESTERTFPVVVGPDLTHNGQVDAFVVKVKVDPSAPDPRDNYEWAGFVGGARDDVAAEGQWWSAGHLAIDKDLNVYISNETNSGGDTFPDGDGFGDLPSWDTTQNGDYDAYAVKIRADGTGLAYAGYVGGVGYDHGKGMAVDSRGAAYFTGLTVSDQTTFPVKVGPDLTYNGKADGFVAKVAPDGRSLEYCGYFGGDDDDSGQAVALGPEPEQALHVTGWTESTEATFPVRAGPDVTHNGPYNLPDVEGELDTYIGRLVDVPSHADPRANWDYMGYIGGNGLDLAFWLDVDDRGDVYISGDTWSDRDTFPGGRGMGRIPGLGEGNHGERDAYIAKVHFEPVDDGLTILLPSLGKNALASDLVAGAAAAPSHTSQPFESPTHTPTSTPTRLPAAPLELPPGEELVFHDDFEDPHSGWQEFQDDAHHVLYVDGTLELFSDEVDGQVMAIAPVQDWGDGALEFTLERVDDSDGFIAVLFGPSRFTCYILLIYDTGHYALAQRWASGNRIYIQPIRSPHIRPGVDQNRFRLERYGGRLVFMANGELVTSIEDPGLSERGGIHLVAASNEKPFTVRVDDMVVTRWTADRPTPTAPPTATRAPTRTPRATGPTPTRPAGEVIYEDDFEDPGSGWATEEDAQDTIRYVDGEYEIVVHDTELFLRLLAPQVACADCTVEVDFKFQGAILGAAGLYLAERDPNDGVVIQIASNGSYIVERFKDGAWEDMIPLTSSTAIKRGAGQVNHLKAVRDQGRLELWINGTTLKSADAPGLVEAGRAGVIAIAATTPEFGVRYDNFVVRAGAALARPESIAGALARIARPWR